jgi:hypothetical protein
MQLQPSARAVQRTAPVQQLFFSQAAIARRGNAGLSEEILI